jgi:hypothetical protein
MSAVTLSSLCVAVVASSADRRGRRRAYGELCRRAVGAAGWSAAGSRTDDVDAASTGGRNRRGRAKTSRGAVRLTAISVSEKVMVPAGSSTILKLSMAVWTSAGAHRVRRPHS